MSLDITKIPLDDQPTWDLISSGKVKGCFQIESHLGQQWCEKVKPQNLEELSDVISLIRPGVKNFIYDGKSMAQHYVDRKFGLDEATPLDPSLEDILKETYQVILYQEQVIFVAQKIAGFTGIQADSLRKAVGHKDAELMNKVRLDFIKGCEQTKIVDSEKANLIFDNIQKSARYLFNKSHGVNYALIGYWGAYLKANYPNIFYKNWLQESGDKMDSDKEKAELISAAKEDKISVYPPSLDLMNENFQFGPDGIYFGFCNVKNVGKSEFAKFKKLKFPPPQEYTSFLLTLLSVNKRVVDNLVTVGVFESYGSRSRLLHDLECLRDLSEKEMTWLTENLDDEKNLVENLICLARPRKEGGGVSNVNRAKAVGEIVLRVENPGRDLADNPLIYAKREENLLGCALTCSELDSCPNASFADTTCAEFSAGKPGKCTVAIILNKVYEYICKNGEKMGFLGGADNSGKIENIVIFPVSYSKYSDIIYPNATVLLTGSRGRDNSFVVEHVYQI